MSATEGFGRWRPVVGVLALGVFAFSLSLEGAPAGNTRAPGDREGKTTRPERQPEPKQLVSFGVSKGGATEPAAVADGIPILKAGKLLRGDILGDIPVAAPVTVDYRDDEPSRMRLRGELVGPYRPMVANVAAGAQCPATACTFDVECDDGVPPATRFDAG